MLHNDFLEFLELLEEKQVDYLVVGGYAVCAHGFPRYTGDLDVLIAINPKNAQRMLDAFHAFGFAPQSLHADAFLEANTIVEMGREPLKIQVLTGIDGVDFEQCKQNIHFMRMSGKRLPFIGLKELLLNKQATGRAKDRIDVTELQTIHAKKKHS